MVQIADVLNSMRLVCHNHGTQRQMFHSIHDHVFGLKIAIEPISFLNSIKFAPNMYMNLNTELFHIRFCDSIGGFSNYSKHPKR